MKHGSRRTANSKSTQDTFEWWSESKMIQELGAELAADLIKRHRIADPKCLSKFVKPYPDCVAGFHYPLIQRL